MRRRFSKDEILAFLRQAAAGTPVMDLCWNNCFSRSTFRAWKAKYGDAIQMAAVLPARRQQPVTYRGRRSLAFSR